MKQITGKLFVLSVAYVSALQKWKCLTKSSAGLDLSSTPLTGTSWHGDKQRVTSLYSVLVEVFVVGGLRQLMWYGCTMESGHGHRLEVSRREVQVVPRATRRER